MKSISIILRRPPYGTVDAPEAIRHALGGVTEELPVKLILLDGGVNAARKKQDTSATAYLNMEAGVRDCIDMGVEVYADKGSMEEALLSVDDMIEGVVVADRSRIAAALAETGTTMIF
jgi:sulfur relay (sulfurtransferase) DsrF/TusC family protein